MLASNILELLCFVFLRWYLSRENRKKEEFRQHGDVPDINSTTFSDLTDKQNPKYIQLWSVEGQMLTTCQLPLRLLRVQWSWVRGSLPSFLDTYNMQPM